MSLVGAALRLRPAAYAQGEWVEQGERVELGEWVELGERVEWFNFDAVQGSAG